MRQAYETASALRGWVLGTLKLATLVSQAGPANIQSRSLAQRLRAMLAPEAAKPDRDDLVYRHRP